VAHLDLVEVEVLVVEGRMCTPFFEPVGGLISAKNCDGIVWLVDRGGVDGPRLPVVPSAAVSALR
jgi:hypothetical protein